MMSLLLLLLFLLAPNGVSSQDNGVGSRGYLFVSNRLDEVIVARLSLGREANVTLVADAATVAELDARELEARADRPIFDVVLRSEDVVAGSATGDSMGFRVQKLEALRRSPYDITLYLDSDVYACKPLDAIFDALGDADAGGVAQHETIVNGGVLVYKKSAAPLWKKWAEMYALVSADTRREQPVLQAALKWAETELYGFKFARLPRTFNCRGVSKCGLQRNRAGEAIECHLLHSHEVLEPRAEAAQTSRAAEAAGVQAAFARSCPTLSGGHPLVAVLEAGVGAGGDLQAALEAPLRHLAKDNDAGVCVTSDPSRPTGQPAGLEKTVWKCFKSRTRYAAVVLVSASTAAERAALVTASALPRAAPVPIAIAWLPRRSKNSNGNAAWFCGSEVTCTLAAAIAAAQKQFLVVLLGDRPRRSAQALSVLLPSHFLNLDRAFEEDDRPADRNVDKETLLLHGAFSARLDEIIEACPKKKIR